MAAQENNAAGGIRGRKVVFDFQDSQCKGELSVRNLQYFAAQRVPVVVGDTCSSATLAASPVAEQNRVVLITPISGADAISSAGDYVFRNFIPNSYYSTAAARLFEKKGVHNIAVLYINNDAGISWKEAFVNSFKGQITIVESYAPEEKDFRSVLLKIQETKPEQIFLAGYYPDGALILKQAKELGITAPFFGAGDPYDDPEFIVLAGDAAEGFQYQTVPAGSGQKWREFSEKYKLNYGEEPSLFASYAYDTAHIIFDAMEHCGTSADAIKDCLYATDYDGVTNHITFNTNGDLVAGRTMVKEIKEGKAVETKK